MAFKVFVSHSSKDRAWVELIRDETQGFDVDVYLHEYDAQPGGRLSDKLQAAIRRCDALVVLFTKNATSSTYVQQEIGYALGQKKVVVPLLEKGVADRELAMLIGNEWIPFDPAAPFDAINELTAFLAKKSDEQWQTERAILLIVSGALLVLAATSK